MFVTLLLALAEPGAAAPAPAPAAEAVSAAEAERLALAQAAAVHLLPPGSYGRMMTEVMGGSMEGAVSAMLDMSAAEMNGTGETKEGKGETLRESALRQDPHFAERMRIMTRVMGEEFGRLGHALEPRLREGMARSMARRFTVADLKDINGFFATPSGGRFASQTLMMWADPEMMKSVVEGIPELMKEMPAIMTKVEAATAHLPKPEADGKRKRTPRPN